MTTTYLTKEDSLRKAKDELNFAQKIYYEIYQSRQIESDENELIRKFYYSFYHIVNVITTSLLMKIDFKSHSALISKFGTYVHLNNFLDDSFTSALSKLFFLRDLYDYRNSGGR